MSWKAKTQRAGFTLVESLIAATLFSGISYVLYVSLQASEQSHTTVTTNRESNRQLRESTSQLRDELKGASRATITTADDADGNTILRFQTAIESSGVGTAWGVFDRRIDVNEDNCHQADWYLSYEVATTAGQASRLVRRVFDSSDNFQFGETLADNVTSFRVDESGDVWVVALQTMGPEGVRSNEFDVRTRDL